MESTVQVPKSWDLEGLKGIGFQGFKKLVGLRKSYLPADKGIYVVLRATTAPPVFLPKTASMSIAAKKSNYSIEVLENAWVSGASVVYIGKTEAAGGLAERVHAFATKSASHSGGRALWQSWMQTMPSLSAG